LVTTGADWPAVTLKKPPMLMWPVTSVVAVCSIVSRAPLASAVNSTSNAVTAPMAAPRNMVRLPCWVRLRSAI